MEHNEQISNNPKILRARAIKALTDAKALEAEKIKNGAKWQAVDKGYVLRNPTKDIQ
ncbi:hypothetical protein Q4603_05815 [Zobellia galactanivorans]|uniref:hypothetical protein n=1 Tax=Zobellia galactanivorans (strain DSM 12802 / CCUG 47099 / CIP 106680 / NCIMB 13871 / Dsij) TaxID=63186 RepID=UPI0026E3C2C2|nr:hypothetical protein [Zobellia galactanivorans]MDO6808112.1 hypothetical protein [Zobellia galactanivorans]